MNPQEVAELNQLILKIRDRGKTIFIIEHNMKVIMDICDRIAVLDFGQKIAEGPPAEGARRCPGHRSLPGQGGLSARNP